MAWIEERLVRCRVCGREVPLTPGAHVELAGWYCPWCGIRFVLVSTSRQAEPRHVDPWREEPPYK